MVRVTAMVREGVDGGGAADQEALRVVDAVSPEQLECGFGLDALSDRLVPEPSGEVDDGFDDVLVLRVFDEVADEFGVDLQDRDR